MEYRSKREVWEQIQQKWPDLAEFMKSLSAEFGKLESVQVERWPE